MSTSNAAAAAAAQEPTTFTIVALAVGGVALLFALGLLLWQMSKTSPRLAALEARVLGLEGNVKVLDADSVHKKDYVHDTAEIGRLRTRLAQAEKDIAALRRAPRTAGAPAADESGTAAPAAFAVKLKPRDEELYRDFLAAYDEARKKNQELAGNYKARELRNQFQETYHLRGISCTNYGSRMKDAEQPAVFSEADFIAAGFWAFPLPDGSGRYAVVPSFQDYTSVFHQQAGGSDVFDSDYRGGICKNIRVVRPAIFSSLATLEAKGRLELS